MTSVYFGSLAFLRLNGLVVNKPVAKGTKIMKLIRWQTPTLSHWPAFDRLSRLDHDLEALFGSPFAEFDGGVHAEGDWIPAVDVYEDENNYTVQAELPGMAKEDIAVSLQNGSLIVSGERKKEAQPEGTGLHRAERVFCKFERVVTLPDAVQADQVKADYQEGILTINLPKAEEAKPKRIEVKVG